MATQAQLDSVNAAITALETAATTGIQRYTLPSGYEVVRADFGRTLTVLYAQRRQLENDLAAASRSRVRLWGRM